MNECCLQFALSSGRRGSNPRPTAWKAVALPTELLPHEYLFFDFASKQNHWLNKCGERRIRTFEVVRQRIYSPSQLATLVSPQLLS